MINDMWLWHLFVGISAAVAGVCFFVSTGLRLQSSAVLAGALVWFLNWLAFVPSWFRSTRPVSFDDNTTGIGLAVGIDCCAISLGGYQALLCVALIVQMMRMVTVRKKRAEDKKGA